MLNYLINILKSTNDENVIAGASIYTNNILNGLLHAFKSLNLKEILDYSVIKYLIIFRLCQKSSPVIK